MSASRIAARYAKSLIELASEQGKLDRVHEDVEHFRDAAKVRDLELLLNSPIVNSAKKGQIFKALFGDKFDVLTMSFLNIILKKGRENRLMDIADAFILQYNQMNQTSDVILKTAAPLKEGQLEQIKSKIKESGLTLSNINLEQIVDPSLLGGFIIELGDKQYDASVAYKLDEMRKAFS